MPFIELVAQRRSPSPPPGMQPPENAKDWFRVENSAEDADETDIYVYDSIGGWFGMYSDEFIHALKAVTTSKINLRLNSPGGSVFEGIAIANAIRNHPATVTVYVDSLAASIAPVIALAGDRVVMMPQSQFMVHNASGGCYGDATEMTKMADLLDKQSLNIAKAYAEHTGRPLAEWQDYMADETWFTAEEAVAAGLADEVMPMRPRKNEDAEEPAALANVMNRTWDLSVYNYAGRDAAPTPVIPLTTAFAKGGLITNSADVTPPAPETAETMSAELVASPGVLSNMSRDDLVAMLREIIRDELAVAQPQEPEPVDETEQAPEPAAEETPPEPEAAATEEAADPEDADKKLPAFLQPDEDEEDDEEDPDDETTAEPSDEWGSIVSRLTDTPSFSADDVFNSLKEAW